MRHQLPPAARQSHSRTYPGPEPVTKCSRPVTSVVIHSGSSHNCIVTDDRPFALCATTSQTAKPPAVETADPRNLPALHVRLHPQARTAAPHGHAVHSPAANTRQGRLHAHEHRPVHRKQRGIGGVTFPVFEHSFDITRPWHSPQAVTLNGDSGRSRQMGDVLIRRLSDKAVARIDSDASARGVSRREYLRQRFESERTVRPAAARHHDQRPAPSRRCSRRP